MLYPFEYPVHDLHTKIECSLHAHLPKSPAFSIFFIGVIRANHTPNYLREARPIDYRTYKYIASNMESSAATDIQSSILQRGRYHENRIKKALRSLADLKVDSIAESNSVEKEKEYPLSEPEAVPISQEQAVKKEKEYPEPEPSAILAIFPHLERQVPCRIQLRYLKTKFGYLKNDVITSKLQLRMTTVPKIVQASDTQVPIYRSYKKRRKERAEIGENESRNDRLKIRKKKSEEKKQTKEERRRDHQKRRATMHEEGRKKYVSNKSYFEWRKRKRKFYCFGHTAERECDERKHNFAWRKRRHKFGYIFLKRQKETKNFATVFVPLRKISRGKKKTEGNINCLRPRKRTSTSGDIETIQMSEKNLRDELQHFVGQRLCIQNGRGSRNDVAHHSAGLYINRATSRNLSVERVLWDGVDASPCSVGVGSLSSDRASPQPLLPGSNSLLQQCCHTSLTLPVALVPLARAGWLRASDQLCCRTHSHSALLLLTNTDKPSVISVLIISNGLRPQYEQRKQAFDNINYVTKFNSGLTKICVALDNEAPRANEGEMRSDWSSAGMQGRRKRVTPDKNLPTSGIVRQDSHLRKSRSGPAGDRTWFVLAGGEHREHAKAKRAARNKQRWLVGQFGVPYKALTPRRGQPVRTKGSPRTLHVIYVKWALGSPRVDDRRHVPREGYLLSALYTTSNHLFAPHRGEPGSILDRVAPGFSHAGIVPDDAARGSPVSPPFHSVAVPFSAQSPPSALKSSPLRAAQISSLAHSLSCPSSRVRLIRSSFRVAYWLTVSADVKGHAARCLLVATSTLDTRAATAENEILALLTRSHKSASPESRIRLSSSRKNAKFLGREVVSLLASRHGESGSIPGRVTSGFSHVGIVLDDAAGWRDFSGISRFPRTSIPAPLNIHLASPTSDLKTSLLRAAQISSLIIHSMKSSTAVYLAIHLVAQIPIPAFTWGDFGKPWKPEIRMADRQLNPGPPECECSVLPLRHLSRVRTELRNSWPTERPRCFSTEAWFEMMFGDWEHSLDALDAPERPGRFRANSRLQGKKNQIPYCRMWGNTGAIANEQTSEDKIDLKLVYTKVTFAIGSEFIIHALDDSAPIADLQRNKKRIPYCQMQALMSYRSAVSCSSDYSDCSFKGRSRPPVAQSVGEPLIWGSRGSGCVMPADTQIAAHQLIVNHQSNFSNPARRNALFWRELLSVPRCRYNSKTCVSGCCMLVVTGLVKVFKLHQDLAENTAGTTLKSWRYLSVQTKRLQRYDGNTARLARRSDEALGVRVTVARIDSSLLDLGRTAM
ncbi:hypothetical protein PR048_012393 [Dryococelus australis]|uniref:Uncharacterized protein n=1 Tax=Dryococelus australis TaxID=614101 RepID=A0ABQ9HP81_9NEOP|nr:hypothetical protein PR048_012393 [Dryococelus australis]